MSDEIKITVLVENSVNAGGLQPDLRKVEAVVLNAKAQSREAASEISR